jgi:hypothetical protein
MHACPKTKTRAMSATLNADLTVRAAAYAYFRAAGALR